MEKGIIVLLVTALSIIFIFRDILKAEKVLNANKRGLITTFVCEDNPTKTKSVLSLDSKGLSERFESKLSKGRYVIHPPVGYAVVGKDEIELSDESTNSMVTMTNGNDYLFVNVTI